MAAFVTALACRPLAAQSTGTSGALWPAFDLHVPLTPSLKLLAFGELKTDEDVP